MKSRFLLLALPLMLAALTLQSCGGGAPDHAKYIPKDATVVVGVNTKAIQKKLAWSAITGSKMLDDLRAQGKDGEKANNMIKDAENAGIDYNSTLYFFGKTDNRYQGDMRMGVVVPLADAGKLESFLKKNFEGVNIVAAKDRKEAALGDKAYASWTDKVLIVQSTLNTKTEIATPYYGDTAVGGAVDTFRSTENGSIDMPATQAEMQAAFALEKKSSILDNDRFTKLEGENNDVTVFVNYGSMMDQMASSGGAGMMMGLTRSLYANTAFTTGLNFENGKIVADMRYYPSDSMRGVSKAMGNDEVAGDLLNRMPGQNLNMAVGYHIAPASIRVMLDKMGMTAMANMGLMQYQITIDNILAAFTGDIAFTLNNFNYVQKSFDFGGMDSTMLEMMPESERTHWEPGMDYTYAMGIKDRKELDKLMTLAVQQGGLQASGKDRWIMPGGDQSEQYVLAIVDNKYLVASKAPGVDAFAASRGGLSGDARKTLDGNPVGFFVDVQSMLSKMPPQSMGSDSVFFVEARNLMTTAWMNGGQFKSDASTYRMEVNMVNKDENALIQLLNFAQRMNAANKRQEAAMAAEGIRETEVVPAPVPVAPGMIEEPAVEASTGR